MGAPAGNRNAAKAKIWEQAIIRACRPSDLQEIAEMVVLQAKNGQQWAVQEIGNRLDGKPVQQVDMSGDLSLTRTLRDLTDDELLRIATQAQAAQQEGDGETMQ